MSSEWLLTLVLACGGWGSQHNKDSSLHNPRWITGPFTPLTILQPSDLLPLFCARPCARHQELKNEDALFPFSNSLYHWADKGTCNMTKDAMEVWVNYNWSTETMCGNKNKNARGVFSENYFGCELKNGENLLWLIQAEDEFRCEEEWKWYVQERMHSQYCWATWFLWIVWTLEREVGYRSEGLVSQASNLHFHLWSVGSYWSLRN